ncbi:pilin [Candidatus Saccharibacteria bacterium]|nr:pilin [Candidatus Saccharibacteria bacterium]
MMNYLHFFALQLIDPHTIPKGNPNALADGLDLTFKIIGALAFLFLVISGFRYVISSGEPQKVAEVRRQIIYIIVGLILAVSADLIVNFVIKKT